MALRAVEGEVVVAGDDDLPSVGEVAEPAREVAHLLQLPGRAEVAGVEQHVARGQQRRELPVPAVRVGDADEPQGLRLRISLSLSLYIYIYIYIYVWGP